MIGSDRQASIFAGSGRCLGSSGSWRRCCGWSSGGGPRIIGEIVVVLERSLSPECGIAEAKPMETSAPPLSLWPEDITLLPSASTPHPRHAAPHPAASTSGQRRALQMSLASSPPRQTPASLRSLAHARRTRQDLQLRRTSDHGLSVLPTLVCRVLVPMPSAPSRHRQSSPTHRRRSASPSTQSAMLEKPRGCEQRA
jgi:hypothetical protein